MNRVLTLTAAFMVLVAGFCVVGQSEAEAGLFDRNKCCKTKKCRTPRRSRAKCCKPACCEPQPCCEAAPACECQAAAPTCCEDSNKCCLTRRQARKACRKNSRIQQCSCTTCEGAPEGCTNCAGGEEAAPLAPEADSAT